jgi:hypothetical protein
MHLTLKAGLPHALGTKRPLFLRQRDPVHRGTTLACRDFRESAPPAPDFQNPIARLESAPNRADEYVIVSSSQAR